MVEMYHSTVEYRYDILRKFACLWEFWLFLIWRVNLLWLKCSALSFSLSLSGRLLIISISSLYIYSPLHVPSPPLPVWPGFLLYYSHYPTATTPQNLGGIQAGLPLAICPPIPPSLPPSTSYIHLTQTPSSIYRPRTIVSPHNSSIFQREKYSFSPNQLLILLHPPSSSFLFNFFSTCSAKSRSTAFFSTRPVVSERK